MKPSTDTLMDLIAHPGETMARDMASRNANTVVTALAVLMHAAPKATTAFLNDVFLSTPATYAGLLQELLEPVLTGEVQEGVTNGTR